MGARALLAPQISQQSALGHRAAQRLGANPGLLAVWLQVLNYPGIRPDLPGQEACMPRTCCYDNGTGDLVGHGLCWVIPGA